MVQKTTGIVSMLGTRSLPRATTQPVISVVTICKDYESGFERTYKSVAQQMDNAPEGSIEWIVVNGSTRSDTIEKMLDCAGDMVAWSQSKPDGGIYPAMNIGLEHATGHFVNFMNAGDCFLERDTLSKVTEIVAQNPKFDLMYGDYYYDDVYREATDDKVLGKIDLPTNHQAMFFRRETIGDQRHNETFRIAGDMDFYCNYRPKIQTACRLNFPVSRFESGGISSRNGMRSTLESISVRREHSGLTMRDFKVLAACVCGHMLRQCGPNVYEGIRGLYHTVQGRGAPQSPPSPSAQSWTPVQV